MIYVICFDKERYLFVFTTSINITDACFFFYPSCFFFGDRDDGAVLDEDDVDELDGLDGETRITFMRPIS